MKIVRLFLVAASIAFSIPALAQPGQVPGPGPGPPPSPWIYASPLIYPPAGSCIAMPQTVTGGCPGGGNAINVSGGYYLNGVALDSISAVSHPLTFSAGTLGLGFNSSLALDGSNSLGVNPTNPTSIIWTADQFFASGRPFCQIRAHGAVQNGAESGGVWTGTDDTAAWSACNSELAALGGGAIVVDPAPGFSCVKSGFTPAAGVFIVGFGSGYGGQGNASTPQAPSVVSTCGADVTLFTFSNPATGMKGIYAQGTAFGTHPTVLTSGLRVILEDNFIFGGAPPLQMNSSEGILIANQIQGGYAGSNSNISANVYATLGFYGIRNNFDTTWFGAPSPGTLNAGAIAAWAPTTAYVAGAIVTMTGPDTKNYYVKVPAGGGGTSGSGSQPTVMPIGQTFVDGTVTWRLLRPVGPGGFYYDLQCDGCSTMFLQQNDLSGAAIGLGITNNVSAVPQNNNLVNNSFGNNWGYGIYAHDGWGLNVIGGYANSCATTGCVGIASTGNWASSLQIADVLMFNNPTGVSFGHGTQSALKGSQIFNASTAAVNIAPNLTDVTVSNNMLGNDTTHGPNANAVVIQTGTGDYLTVANNDMNGATSGITNGASGTHLNICNNLGDVICITTLPPYLLTTATPPLPSSGRGYFGADSTYGATLIGNGINDVTLMNRNGTNVCNIAGGGTTFNCNALALVNPLTVAQGGTGGGAASGTLLDNITGFSSTGFIKRTGAGTYTFTADPSDVTSVFGRTGAVVAAANDYNFNQLAGTAAPAQLPTATSLAQGALPAWPGNATTYFRGDGSYPTLNCAALQGVAASCATDTTNAGNISSGTLGSARGGAGTISGALKGNGAGVVSQAGCGDLSNASPSCSTDATNASNLSSGNIPQARAPTGGMSGQFWQTNGSGTGAWASTRQAIAYGFTNTIGAGNTDYCWNQGCSTVVQTSNSGTFPFAGTFKNLYFNVTTAPGAGQTFTATLYVGTFGSETATALTCQITGSNTSCPPDTTHTASITAGQAATLQIVSGGTATTVGGSWGGEFDSP